MKDWIATYTEDNGQTMKTMFISAETYTQAYIFVSLKTEGIITEIKGI